MYIVPHRTPAQSAAMTPRFHWLKPLWVEDALANKAAPANIRVAPPSTLSQRIALASRSSSKRRYPQKIPSRLFVFHKGKAMLKPTSRIAKMVNVLATAQRQPASTAQTTRWGAWRTSWRTLLWPRMRAGKLQRARKTPTTISSDTTIGETPECTSLVGASAAPSQAPAANPHSTPVVCNFLSCFPSGGEEDAGGG